MNLFSSQLKKTTKQQKKIMNLKKNHRKQRIKNKKKKIMSTLNQKHLNRIYWVPLPNNVSCLSGEKIPVFFLSQNILKQVLI